MILDLTNSHNPYIKLSAKSEFMPIETFRVHFPFYITPPWLEDELFPMFQDGMVRMDNLVLDGTFEQFRHLKDEENQSVIGMTFTCRSFIVSNMGIQLPFKDISASVDIRDGNLKVSSLNGVFGNSQIKEGSLDVQGMADGHPLYKVFVDGDFDIRELMSHREMYVVPETARERIENFKGLDGRLSARTTILYQKGWKVPRILSGDFSFRNTLYYRKPLGLPLHFSQVDFHFSEDGNNSFSGEGAFGETPFSASGTVVIKGSELLFTHADIKASAEMNQLINGCVNPGKFPFEFKEPLPWDITLDRDGDTYRYKGRIDTEKLFMESDRLWIHTATRKSSVSFDLTGYTDGKIDINNVDFSFGNSKITLSGEYYTAGEKLNTINILTRNLSLGDFGIQFKGSEDVFYGLLDAGLDVSFVGKNLSGMQITGNLKGKSIFFPSRFTPLPVRNMAFRLDLSGKKGFINRCDLKFGDHPLHIKGILQGWDTIKGDLLATTDYIDLTKLITRDRDAADKITPSQGKALLKTSDIDLKINASKGIWQKLEFKRLNAEMKFSAKNILIKNAQAELETGDVSLSGKIGRGRSEKINVSGKVNLENQPIDKLISDTGFGDRGVKGTLTLNSSVMIDGDINNGILKNLSGNLDKVVITKGLLKNSRVFLKILDLLNIPDKFRERPPEMREEGFYFENIEGTARINKGILKTEGFMIKSPVFNAVGSGEENLYNETHNIRLLVQPLTNIDFIISHIPIVGRILAGDNETLFTVGYDVKGSWSKPDLSIVPMENLKGLLGVFKRALLTPYKIIENINNAAKSIKKTAPEETGNNELSKTKQP